MMTEHVLVVGTGRDYPARIRADLPGTQTSVMVQLEYVGKVREPGENRFVIGVRGDASDQEWIDLAAAAHAHQPFTRILTVGERNQDRCAVIGVALGLYTHSRETVELVHDKQAMRVRLHEAGVDSTAYARVASLAELQAFFQKHGKPCVVKPVSGSGSAGVAKVTKAGELADAFEQASGSYLGLAATGVLAEEFLDGPQFSVEAFSEAGEHEILAITAKFSDPVTFVELGHVIPAPLPADQEQEVRSYVERVLCALGVEFGPTHTEIILSEAGPRVIETHVREGGDLIPALTLDATGVDISDCVVRQTLGEKVLAGIRATLTADRVARSSAIWFAAVNAAGVLDSVAGVEDAGALPNVTKVEVLARPGAQIGTLKSSESRLASARAIAPTTDEAVTAARDAIARLDFRLRMRSLDGPTV